jgi:hypothetical protein
MIIKSWMGYDHRARGKNCQDLAFCANTPAGQIKGVLDGCSECPHAEVGVKLFADNIPDFGNAQGTVAYLCKVVFDSDPRRIMDFMLFTTLMVLADQQTGNTLVLTCGDGYIIKQRLDNTFEYVELPHQEYPDYLAYNFCRGLVNREMTMQRHIIMSGECKNIGVATDGLRYILGTPWQEKLESALLRDSDASISRIINQDADGNGKISDDLAIAF